jgi:hypothetical protein
MASHDPVAGSADLFTNQGEGEGEANRAELKNQDDAALLVSAASKSINLKLT